MLDGDFAFVILDEAKDEIYAARDPGKLMVLESGVWGVRGSGVECFE